MSEVATAIKQFQSKQKHGSVMEPREFEGLVQSTMKKYKLTRKKAERVAGRACWKGAK